MHIAQDESSAKEFFEKCTNADFVDPGTRDTALSYFINKFICTMTGIAE